MRVRIGILLAAVVAGTVGDVRGQGTYTWNASQAAGGTGGTGTAWIRNGGANLNWTGGTAGTMPGVDNNASTTIDGNANDVAVYNLTGSLTSVIGMSASTNNGVTGNGAANGLLSVGGIANATAGTTQALTINASSAAVTPPGILQLNGAYAANTAGLAANTLISATGGNITFDRGTTNLLDMRLGITGGGIDATAGRSVTIGMNVSATAAGFGVTKTGAGSLYLNGTNTYTGTTTVAGGTLGGTGTVAGAVLAAGGATVRGGNAAGVGTLTIQSGGLTLANTGGGANLGIRISTAGGGGAAGSGASSGGTATAPANNNFVLVSAGGITADPDALNYLIDGAGASFVGTQSYSYRVGQSVGQVEIVGVNVTNPARFTFTNFTATPTNVSLTGDVSGVLYLNFTPVPEPATVGLIGAAVLGAGAVVRRKRRKA